MPRTLRPDPGAVPPPDMSAEPLGFVVEADDGTRLHFLDWGRPAQTEGGVLLVPGFGHTAWSWTPVARRLRGVVHVVAMDLRGHGLSDAPVDGYEVRSLAEDALAVIEGSGLGAARPMVVAGHGFGADVAVVVAGALGERCAGVVLVDGGWERIAEASGLTPDEMLRTLGEPPEVLASMRAFLADRRAFDPASWDADQERAARATVVELPSKRLVPAIHPHVRDAVVAAMFGHDPREALSHLQVPVLALAAADDERGGHRRALRDVADELDRGGPAIAVAELDAGHDLMRYRPAEVAAAILAAGLPEAPARSSGSGGTIGGR
ncbi:MAG TPA: alpha/beta hydrolase [Candidatus Dormibacteraeota bacterium]|nr:alpha/beta hydrolase [Candidatus Dormibacteraeota bacterium]